MQSEGPNSNLIRPVGDVVKAWREERKLTAADLVARAGPPISRAWLSQLENGKIGQPRDAKRLTLLAQALDIPVSHLLMRR
jgi:transcriptional regulator with XRE-family HTH domain